MVYVVAFNESHDSAERRMTRFVMCDALSQFDAKARGNYQRGYIQDQVTQTTGPLVSRYSSN
ncbi:Hypothetical protein CpCap5W_1207 [Corynebacterium pseudotuberculosis]|uniref:Uncharacterized protein n=1 Tax=Corynebacterium pseudotuberculosis (strain C231) TaxID=681645 RepID=D9QBK6_CORP2|nr:hypothetical protein CPC231_07390 [Corynebacterium pseudotuberculosis C231]ADL21334.1 hypothetical protein CP1002_05755 [Corynebacterium pseudotuberculosis 1002]ADO26732.1 hypothetical protein CPI19_04130 [Corynebacterium pseudotuberculosis I19]AFF22619.1 Hypothetical protein CpP54B96_1491 [Corynebacterium pseudotuberculosis P54B96]AFH52416.1 Hypothetical protein Cp267_1526 [Corynebacterium pseudotuberculosis 267]AJC14200.1 Hypothetical protein CpVD57_1495 [Corynebacterium pseudotuberculosi